MCMGGGGSSGGGMGTMVPLVQVIQQAPKAPGKSAGSGSGSNSTGAGATPGTATTLLTGPQGVDQSKLTLAKNTLLGL